MIEQRGWDATVFPAIQKLLSGSPGTAVFDFDNTLIKNDLGEAVMYYIVLQGLLRADLEDFWQELRHDAIDAAIIDRLRKSWDTVEESGGENTGEFLSFADRLLTIYGLVYERAGMEEAYRWTRTLFGFQPAKEMRSISRYVFDYEQTLDVGVWELPSGLRLPRGLRIYTEIQELIAALHEREWDVRIVTASPQEIIQTVSPRWNIPEEKVHGMVLRRRRPDGEPEDRAILEPFIVEPMTVRAGKVARLRAEGVDVPDLMVGDSIGDFELLQHARTGILIDRGNAELRGQAEAAGLLIQPPFPINEQAPPGAADLPWP